MLIRVEQSAEKQSLIHYQETHEVAQSFGKSLAIKKKSHIQKPILLQRFVSLPNRKVPFMRRGVTQAPMGGRRWNGRANERETLSDSCPIEALSASTACSLSASAV